MESFNTMIVSIGQFRDKDQIFIRPLEGSARSAFTNGLFRLNLISETFFAQSIFKVDIRIFGIERKKRAGPLHPAL